MAPAKEKWQPQPQDAIALAALRWYALKIDQLLIEIYATDRRQFEGLETTMNDVLGSLYKFAASLAAGDPDECPPGFTLCKDGFCAPACGDPAPEKI